MVRRMLPCLTALMLTALLAWLIFTMQDASPRVLDSGKDRQLLRIWCVSSVGGGDSWLKAQLQLFERQNPGVMTYLRSVSPQQLTEENAVLPDVVLYMPGDVGAPQDLFTPVAGTENIREALLRCGRWQGQQFGLPLCWGAYVLCVDSAMEPGTAVVPAPTTLLGRPAATPEPTATALPYPNEAVLSADTPLLAPSGAGVFTLCRMLKSDFRPDLPSGMQTAAEVYSRFRSRQCASALLTTGQLTAFASLTSAGKGFACRTIVPEEIITDQVWLAGIVTGAEESAAPRLLAFLTGTDAQQALTSQNLHTVRLDRKLYASGVEGEVESAAARSLTAINAYVSAADVQTAAWQVYTSQASLSDALLPLL